MNATYLGTGNQRFDDHQVCSNEIARLTAENRRLREELASARARQQDLVSSAEIWIRLYEAHLARARKPGSSCSPISELPRS